MILTSSQLFSVESVEMDFDMASLVEAVGAGADVGCYRQTQIKIQTLSVAVLQEHSDCMQESNDIPLVACPLLSCCSWLWLNL